MTYPRSRLLRLGQTALALSVSLLLAGCFTSSQPKFTLASAVPALGNGGRYIVYQRNSDGSFQRDESFEMRGRADRGYDYIEDKGKVTPVSLHRIGPDRYVAQAIREDGKTADYLVLRLRGNEVLSYGPDCAKQDAAKLKGLGVEIRDKTTCVIDRVADPAALFATLELGEPGVKMVRE
ncbi:MAG: hypothetical protein GEU91_10805 [Rhizobiales bacterium]|nr:hypothetical protein [Hyphomicrobiales bacterium]